tara:strand:- start:523 stop:1770 length:1248 start_codon:yes stop_codon:yes gene_type:complete
MFQRKNKKTVLLISYFVKVKGNCPGEWANDKIKTFLDLNYRVILLTGFQSQIKSNKFLKVLKIPSLSYICFNEELKNCKIKKNWLLNLYALIPKTLGRFLDFIFIKLNGTVSAGYWSWAIISSPILSFYLIKNKFNFIFSTGGPTACHLIGCFISLVFRKPLYCEFQDPLVGNCLNKKLSINAAKLIENIIVNISHRTIFVTKLATSSAKKRNSKSKNKVKLFYPGSRKYFLKNNSINKKKEFIEFLHLGTLYGARNLDLFLKALDELISEKYIDSRNIKVRNVGDIYLENKKEYAQKDYFESISSTKRIKALKIASNSTFLLLIQHSDNRSQETIPYKFYDYMNLGKPILGLLNNSELANMVNDYGGITSKSYDLISIKLALKKSIKLFNESKFSESNLNNKFDIKKQLKKAIR